MQIFVDSLYDAVLDCLKVIPILFLAYLLVSYLSHDHSHKFGHFLSKNRKTSVLYASFLGCIPQCGFSSVMADLYSDKKVSLGTLVAVFVATSDEAIPIMLTNTNKILDMLLLLAIKIVFALFWGYLIDFVFEIFKSGRRQVNVLPTQVTKSIEENSQKQESAEINQTKLQDCHEDEHDHVHEDELEHEHLEHHHECGHIHTDKCSSSCGHEHGCCVNNVFLDAFMHTFEIALYIFVATFIINLIVNYCGTDALANLLTTNTYLQIVIASLIGLIPNCASSVLLVELFMMENPVLSFPALVAGLTSGAGVGLVILWTKNKKKPLQNLGISFLQFVIGVASGMILSLFF